MSPASTPHGYPYPLGTDRLADGDDMIGQLAQAVDTNLGVAAMGQVNVPIVAANTPVSVAVTFPAGRFPSTPAVTVTVRSNAPFQVRASGRLVSASGMTVIGVRDLGTAAFNVDWMAVLAP